MAALDVVEISNALSKVHSSQVQPEEYAQVDFPWQTDKNNFSYQQGYIRFDTENNQTLDTVFEDSYMLVPLTIQSSVPGTPYTETDALAFKESTLSLITGVQIVSAGGDTIVPQCRTLEQSQLRLLIESVNTAPESSLADIQLWKSQNANTAVALTNSKSSGYYYTQTTGLTTEPYAPTNPFNMLLTTPADPTSVATGMNPNYNPGFDQAVKAFKANATFTGGQFMINAVIPLKHIHPWFREMNEPILGGRFTFYFYTPVQTVLSQIGTAPVLTADQPICTCATNSAGVAMAAPQIAIGNSTLNQCYLFTKTVKYSPEVGRKIREKYDKGYTRTISFLQPDVWQNLPNRTNWSTNGIFTDTTSIPPTPSPKRIFMLTYPTGQNGSRTIPFVSIGRFTGFNVKLNGIPYWIQNKNYDAEFWQLLQDCMPNVIDRETQTSLLSYSDFLTQYRIYVADISRIHDVRLNSNVNIEVDYTRLDTNAVDLCYLVEREVTQKWYVDGKTVKVIALTS